MNPWLEKSLLALIGLTLMSVLAFGSGSTPRIMRGLNDFAPLYNSTQLLGTGQLYDSEANYRLLEKNLGVKYPALRFTRPPYVAVLLWPLGQLSYLTAYLIWSLLTLCALGAFVALWRYPTRPSALVATAFCAPAFVSIMTGQDVPLLLLWIALAVHWERKDQPLSAGMILALCASKFHLFTLLPLLMIGQQRWRMLKGFAIGAAALTVLSFAAGGWRWPIEYYETLTDQTVHPSTEFMMNFHGLFSGFPAGVVLEAAATVAVILVSWQVVRRSSFVYGMATVLIGGLLISYHAYLSDCAVLLPAATVIFAETDKFWIRAVAVLLLAPVVYLLIVPYIVPILIIGLFAGAAVNGLRSQAEAPQFASRSC